MKRYLNSEERKDIIAMICLTVNVEEILKNWRGASLGENKDAMKYLKMGNSFIRKGCMEITKLLDPEARQKIMDTANQMTCTVHYNDRKMIAPEPAYILKDWDEMAALATCLIEVTCKECKGYEKDCDAQRIMRRWNIPSQHEWVREGRCEYYWKD